MAVLEPLHRVGDSTDILGESPLWDERQQVLYWVDIRKPALRRLDPRHGELTTWPLADLVGAIAMTEDGRLLIAMGEAIHLFDPRDECMEIFARLPQRIEGHRFNDGRCDRQGRFLVGTMHNVTRAPEGVLYQLQAGKPLKPLIGGIRIPNSLCFSPDGATLYFADSLRHTIEAFDYDTETGTPGHSRSFATTKPPGFPDGATVDAEGFVWSAQFKASSVVRHAPDGRLDRVIELPVAMPTAVTFGGPGLQRLYITTASQFMTAQERMAEPLAGALLALEPGVCGLPETRFRLGSTQACAAT